MLGAVVVVVVALAVVWLMLLAVLALARPDGATLTDAAKVLPDALRLLRRLAADPQVPRSVRHTLWFVAGYLALPFDLVPDFIPILGYADDVVTIAIALRRVVRVAGVEALERHWAGSPAGLTLVRRLAGVT